MNIRISDDLHKELIQHIGPKVKIGAWTEEAIKEKIDYEKNCKPCKKPKKIK